MRLSKKQSQLQNQVMELVHSDRRLSENERYFILENYQESAGALNSLSGAFFTPEGLARDFAIEVSEGVSVIDLCAGIGRLGFALEQKTTRLVCVEYCAAYVEVGKRVLPDAEWIQGDVFDKELYRDLGIFDWSVSNPPFGQIKTGEYQGDYRGGLFEYKVIEMASRVSRFGAFIIPQESASFRYSGEQCYRESINDRLKVFMKQTGITLDNNCGIDTTIYQNEWHGVSPKVEIVTCTFDEKPSSEEQLDIFSGIEEVA